MNTGYQDWLTAKADDAETFITTLKATYPTLPDGGRLIVTKYPQSLSLRPDDGMMLRLAVRIAYDRQVEVITLSQLRDGTVTPPTMTDTWYPPRAPGPR
jgi:hypothetical protein